MTKTPDDIKPPKAIMYALMYPFLARRAQYAGYALAMHGSLANDFDLIAVPWLPDAKSAEELIEDLQKFMTEDIYFVSTGDEATNGVAGLKPHGRRVWAIHLKAWVGAYIDLSVMPRD